MRQGLILKAHEFAICVVKRNTNRLVPAYRKKPGDAARPFKGRHHVADNHFLDRLAGPVSHYDWRPTADTLQIERDTLPVLLVAKVLVASELDVPAVGRPQQRRRRAVEPVARAIDLDRALGETTEIGVLAAQDQGAPMRREGEPQAKVGLAARGLSAVQQDIGRREIRIGLRSRVRDPHRRRRGLCIGQLLQFRWRQPLKLPDEIVKINCHVIGETGCPASPHSLPQLQTLDVVDLERLGSRRRTSLDTEHEVHFLEAGQGDVLGGAGYPRRSVVEVRLDG